MRCLAIVAVFAAGVPLSAQYVYTPPVYSPLTAITSDVRYQGMMSSVNESVADQLVVDSVPSIPVPETTFTFRYSPQRTKENLARFVERTPNPAAKAELQKMFAAQPTIVDDIREGIKVYGYDSHNVADAYAMWWIMAWQASEGIMEEPDRATAQSVAKQVRNAIAATDDFGKASDADRQEYAEALLIQAVILAELIKTVTTNPDVAAQLPALARKGAKDSGLDLSLMTLTRNGFVPRAGADASDASESASPDSEQPIRNAAADDEDDNAMALALAAGAGLGAVLLGGAVMLRRQG